MAPKVYPPSTDVEEWFGAPPHAHAHHRCKRGVPMDRHLERLAIISGTRGFPRAHACHALRTDTCTCPSTGDGFVKPLTHPPYHYR